LTLNDLHSFLATASFFKCDFSYTALQQLTRFQLT